MPLTRQQKQEKVAQMEQDLKGAQAAAVMSYTGLTIADMNELRTKLHQQGSRLRVIPKRLLRLVMQQLKLEFDPTKEQGQVAVVWGDDVVVPAKTTYSFSTTHENAHLIAGVLEGRLLSAKETTALALLPSKKELQGMFVSVISGPVRGLVTVLSGAQRQLLYALQAIQSQKES